jgi:diguanylate cyclase (GGDEF)-like protein
MQLDMITMSAVDITVTTVLGLVLVFTWARERAVRLVGWWGLAMFLQAGGVVIAASAALLNAALLVTIGLSVMVLADSLKWTASRGFANRPTSAAWALLGPFVFLLIAFSGYVDSLRDQFLVFCALTALCNFGAGFELARANGKRLISHWPAVVLLTVTGIGCVSWIPLAVTVPFEEASEAYVSGWFSGINLVMVMVRIALAFVVLAMAKQRQEMEQRVNALTDTLTGLPNRRALYESIDTFERNRVFKTGSISVLFFDLDHFKDVNDTFGHETGDCVLMLFAATAEAHLKDLCLIARLGGEEFAAVLPGVDGADAAATAEAIREAFAKSAADVDGMHVGTTVSVGVASRSSDACGSSDLGALFRQADAALYAAKRTGRNRVEFAGPDGVMPVPATGATVRTVARQGSPINPAGHGSRVAANA